MLPVQGGFIIIVEWNAEFCSWHAGNISFKNDRLIRSKLFEFEEAVFAHVKGMQYLIVFIHVEDFWSNGYDALFTCGYSAALEWIEYSLIQNDRFHATVLIWWKNDFSLQFFVLLSSRYGDFFCDQGVIT